MQNLFSRFSWVVDYIPKSREDRRPFWVLVIAALCLTGIEFLSIASSYEKFTPLFNLFDPGLKGRVSDWLYKHPDYSLHQLIYWSCWNFFFYCFLPACVIKLVWKQKLSDYGLKLKGALKGWPIYAGMLAIILPCVVLVSYEKGFQGTYPFYLPPDKHEFLKKMLVWEIFYALQFISLEFFFRGFLVHGLKNKLGIYSIFIMVVPYCMIHFSKPLPECIGSIIAGIVLGLLSYHYRSVILGACIHIVVAVSMDFLSLWHRGYF